MLHAYLDYGGSIYAHVWYLSLSLKIMRATEGYYLVSIFVFLLCCRNELALIHLFLIDY